MIDASKQVILDQTGFPNTGCSASFSENTLPVNLSSKFLIIRINRRTVQICHFKLFLWETKCLTHHKNRYVIGDHHKRHHQPIDLIQ